MKFKYYNPDINLVIKNKKLLSDLNDIKSIKPGMVCGAVRMFNNGDLMISVPKEVPKRVEKKSITIY